MTDDDIGAPYRDAALNYWDAGWRGILPIPPRSKRLRLTGWTGHEGADTSYADVYAWLDGPEGAGNIALRVPDGVIGIDVDAYAGKRGAETLAAREAEWGPLPATWVSSARPWPSGIRFFRVPTGLAWPGEIGPNVEIVQRAHRYAVVWPSFNPDAGTQYVWIAPADLLDRHESRGETVPLVPRVEDFTELPTEWVHGLANGLYSPDRKAAITDAGVITALDGWVHGAEPCRTLRAAVTGSAARFRHGSRHEALNTSVLDVVRKAERGHRGLRPALAAVREHFLAAAGQAHRGAARSDSETAGEWRRAVAGAVGIVLAQPEGGTPCGCDDDPRDLVPPPDVDNGRPRSVLAAGPRSVLPGGNGPGPGEASAQAVLGGSQSVSTAAPEGLAAFLLPDEVWAFSGLLGHIQRAARARLVSPDVLLHAVLTIVASLLHHDSRIETGKGASVLSYFLAAIGASGTGKSEALKVARELLARWITDRFAITGGGGYMDGPLGSGEGLVEAFMDDLYVDKVDPGTGDPVLNKTGDVVQVKTRMQARHNALFNTDEGRQVLAIDARKGATVLAVMCEMWSGSVAGQTNADKDRTRKLAAGTYVVGMMLGFQTSTIDALFADEAGGAPQRFAFASAEYAPYGENLDDEIEDEWPGQLALDIPVTAVTVHLSTEQKTAVRRAIRLKAAGRSTDGPLDGHRMLLTCRIAGLLTLIHGEEKVSDEMWQLAELLTERSCALRDWLAAQGRRKAEQQRQARQNDAVETAVRTQQYTRDIEEVERTATLIIRFVERTGTPTRRETVNALSGSRRHLAPRAIEHAIQTGRLIAMDEGAKRMLRLPETDGV